MPKPKTPSKLSSPTTIQGDEGQASSHAGQEPSAEALAKAEANRLHARLEREASEREAKGEVLMKHEDGRITEVHIDSVPTKEALGWKVHKV